MCGKNTQGKVRRVALRTGFSPQHPKPPSIRTVAERAGVSTATVSNVLSGKATVTQALVERVKAAVVDLGYVADGAASRLRSGKQALAGVVVPDLSNPFFGTLVSKLETVARQDGFDLLTVSSNNDPSQEAERLDRIRSWRPAGLIVVPYDGALTTRLPRGSHLPIVAVDRIPDDEDAFDLVAVDNRRAAGAVAAHCMEQGFTTCLVVGSTLSISNIRERHEGACAAAGPMRIEVLELGLKPELIRAALRARLLAGPLPEVLFALDHVTSLVAYMAVAELGLAIPGDIAFASFDETEWMRLVTPGVTAIRQPIDAMAEAAWRKLRLRMGGDRSEVDTLRLACTLEVRGSTARPPVPLGAAPARRSRHRLQAEPTAHVL